MPDETSLKLSISLLIGNEQRVALCGTPQQHLNWAGQLYTQAEGIPDAHSCRLSAYIWLYECYVCSLNTLRNTLSMLLKSGG